MMNHFLNGPVGDTKWERIFGRRHTVVHRVIRVDTLHRTISGTGCVSNRTPKLDDIFRLRQRSDPGKHA